MQKNHVGENAVQRLLRGLKGLNQQLIPPTSGGRIELRLDTAGAEVVPMARLIYIDEASRGQRLIGGTLEEIEEFIQMSPLERLLAVRADGRVAGE